jgi:hypothetical protein
MDSDTLSRVPDKAEELLLAVMDFTNVADID